VIEAARTIRRRLFELTGDAYGGKTKPKRPPPDDALNAEYPSPEDVPADVMAYERQRSVVTSDATDAQRWARIVDTLDDERLSGDMTLYRATEDGDDIRPGDWVTLDRAYAEEHNRRWLDGRGQIVEMDVDGEDVLASPTGNYEEAIFAPRELSGPIERAGSEPDGMCPR
jgi:hypothetical protein